MATTLKRFMSVLAIAIGICLFMSAPLMAQSKEQGIRLYNQALQMNQTARNEQDLEKSIEKYKQASRIFETVGEHKSVSYTTRALGDVYARLKHWDKALGQYEKVLNMAKRLHDSDLEADTYFRKGLVYAGRAKATAQPGGGHVAEMPIPGLEELGKQKVWISDVDPEAIFALNCFQKALEIDRSSGNLERAAETLRMISFTYKKLGEHDKALKSEMEAQAIQEKLSRTRSKTGPKEGSRGR